MGKRYIGPKRIKNTEKQEGTHLIRVTYDDDTWEELHPAILKATEHHKGYDLTELRNRRMNVVAKDILKTMLAYNVKDQEVDFLSQLVQTSLIENLKLAATFVWARNGEKARNLDERTLGDIDKVLKTSVK